MVSRVSFSIVGLLWVGCTISVVLGEMHAYFHGWTYVLQHFLSMDVEATLDGGNGLMDASLAGDFTAREAERNAEPCVGMAFETEAAAKAYYNEYASRAGFLTRIISSRKSERDGSIVSRGLGCRNILNIQKSANISNEGEQKRRDGCTATFLVKRENGGRWVVRKFVRDHNHPLVVSLHKRRPTFVSNKFGYFLVIHASLLLSSYFCKH